MHVSIWEFLFCPCAYAITRTTKVTTPVTHMYMPRKICRESAQTQRKSTKINKIHNPAFGGVGVQSAPTWIFVFFL